MLRRGGTLCEVNLGPSDPGGPAGAPVGCEAQVQGHECSTAPQVVSREGQVPRDWQLAKLSLGLNPPPSSFSTLLQTWSTGPPGS